MSNKILSTLNIGNNSYEIDDAFARQKVEEVNNNLLKINPVYSASGSVVSFDNGADNLPLEELIVDINPVQDLHGYDHPWIGGGGKNLFENKFVTSTINGITATVNEEGIVVLNGTATGNVVFDIMPDTITLPSKESYIVSGGADGGGTDTYRLYFEYYNYTNEAWNGLTCTSADAERLITSDKIRNVKIQVFNNVTCDNVVFKPMIRKATETDASFVPYENICPISGWTGANVVACGVNVWDEEWELGSYSTTNGEPATYTDRIRSKNRICVVPNTEYYFKTTNGLRAGNMYFYDVNDMFITAGTARGNKATITPNNCRYMRIAMGLQYGNTYNHDISINYPSSDHDYHPYAGQSIPISWESEAGTVYGGSLDVLTGVLTVTDELITIDGVINKMDGKIEETLHGAALFTTHIGNKSQYANSISNVFKYFEGSYSSMPLYGFVGNSGINETISFIFPSGMTVNDANTWLAEMNNNGSPVTVTRTLAEPITYQLTSHEIKTLLGQNNIFTDINSKNILVSYKANIQKYIDRTKSAIFFGQCDPTSTSTKFTAQIDGITEYFDGLIILLKNGVVTSAAGCTFNINGLGEKGAWGSYDNAKLSTLFAASRSLIFIYDSTLDEGNGGFWWYQGKDSNDNTIGYAIRTNSKSLPLSSILYRYRLLFTSADRTHYIPANNSNSTNTTSIRDVCQEKIDPFGDIVYYGTTTTIQPENIPSPSTLWLQNALSLGYSFNRTGQALTLELWKPVYVKATPYVDGSAIIDADEPYVQDLPITDDGKIYIYLGVAYNTASVELSLHHPIYYCYNGAIRPWLGFTDSEHAQDIVSSVNGKTGTITLTAEDLGAMTGMTILSYGHSTWAEFVEAYEANRVVYCKASSAANPATGQQGRMAFLAYTYIGQSSSSTKAEFQYYRSVQNHTDTQQGDQVFCYSLAPANGGTWSVETRQATSRVIAGTGLASAYTKDKLTLSLDADYKDKIDTLWADYQSRIGQ